MTLTEKLDEFPPFICWAVAKVRPRHRTLTRIASRTSWVGVKVGLVDKFFQACKVNPNHLAKYKRFLAEHKDLSHLTEQQRTAFKRCCARLALSKAKA